MSSKNKKGEGPSKKTEQKQKQKVIEDKTFGLKNKNKSNKVQQYVKSVTTQVLNKNQRGGTEKQIQEEYKQKQEKKKEQEQKALLASLFSSVSQIQQSQLREGEDPKSVLCAYFKAGVCEKGKKCKFAHDLTLDGKSAKIDIYHDPRDKNGKDPERTDIPCQFFIEAVEKNVYGWLWDCPNGEKCIYMHALPQGYVLNRDKKEAEKLKEMMDDDEDEKTLEELIEEERAKLPSEGLTPVNKQSFEAWKKRKAEEKQKKLLEALKEDEKKQGKGKSNILSGKALFSYDPTLFKYDDENAVDEKTYEERNEEEELDVVKEEEEGKQEDSREEDGNQDENGNNDEENNEDGEGNEANEQINGKQVVDQELFKQEEGNGEEEEPDFD